MKNKPDFPIPNRKFKQEPSNGQDKSPKTKMPKTILDDFFIKLR